MCRRVFLGLTAVVTVCALSGSIRISSIRLDSMLVGGVTVPGKWKASSPTVQSDKGEYLAYEVVGKSPRVYFTKEKGPHIAWSFIDQKKYNKHSIGQGRNGWGIEEDETGFILRLRTTEGSFKGWYLSRTKEGKLTLTKEADRGTEVMFRLKQTKSKYK